MELKKWQEEKIRAVLNVFETGGVETVYDKVFIFPDGREKRRQVTLGRGFTEDGGALGKVLDLYVMHTEGSFRDRVRFYLPKIAKGVLYNDTNFISLLERMGREDEVFRLCQDFHFDVKYWAKGINYNENELGLKTALGLLVVQDSILHGSIDIVRELKTFPERPPKKGGDEKIWIRRYCEERREWWKKHAKNPYAWEDGRGTYRMDCMLDCIRRGNWDLNLSINANRTKI